MLTTRKVANNLQARFDEMASSILRDIAASQKDIAASQHNIEETLKNIERKLS